MQKGSLTAAVVIISMLVYGCKKESGPSDTGGSSGPLTEGEKQAIIQTHQSIAQTADTILLGSNPIAGFQQRLSLYQSHPNVENAWIDNSGLHIAFKKAGVTHWYTAPDVLIPPYERPQQSGARDLEPRKHFVNSSNTRVCFVNTMDQDESRRVYRDYFSYLKRKFQLSGFQVTEVLGSNANVQFFKTGLKQFGVVIVFAHGSHSDPRGTTWLQTGEIGSIAGLLSTYQNEVQAGQMDMSDVVETRGGQKVTTTYYTISDKFIQASYAAGDFPGTVVYLGACQGLKNPNTRPMAQAFVAKGASAVIGWTETNSVGPSTAQRLFSFLLCGKTLSDAIRSLPREDKSDTYASAILTYEPQTADNTRLMPTERKAILNLIRPLKDSIYTDRSITMQGNLISTDSISLGVVELNAVALRLGLQSDRRSFSQEFGIKSGTNNLRITGLVDVPNGCACVDSAYTFRGNFNALELWTELRWNTDNTDVDFHLLQPGAAFPGGLWTTADCYYSNKATSWGAFLDVDNTGGRGPEHITIPASSQQGVYRLFVHYYAGRGNNATSAYVTVSVRNGPDQNFGPMALSQSASRGGDVWEVCTIEYPSGTITRVMNKTTLPGLEIHPRADASKR